MTPKEKPISEEKRTYIEGVMASYQSDNLDDLLLSLDPFLKPERVAKFLDVSPDFIYSCIANKSLQSQPLGKKLRRVRLSWLFTWLTTELRKEE